MKTTFLLGAGSSVSAGVPSALDMTKKMLENLASKKEGELVTPLLHYIVGGLIFHNATNGGSPYAGVNVEDLFNAILILKDRRSMEIAPFVGAWHYKLDDLEASPPSADIYWPVYQAITYQLVGDLKNSLKELNLRTYIPESIALTPSSNSSEVRKELDNLRKSFESIIDNIPRKLAEGINKDPRVKWTNFNNALHNAVQQATGRKKSRVFERSLDVMIKELKNLVWVSDHNKTKYFDTLIDWATNERCAAVATLNYDNVVEISAQRVGRELHNGLESINETGDFGFKRECLNFIKLHGSINWTYRKKDGKKTSSEVINNEGDKFSDENYSPAVIFGEKNKLTAKGPFLDLYRAYREALLDSKYLAVIGYSFNDDHINQSIVNWGRKSGGKLVILDPQIKTLCQDHNHKFYQISTQLKDNIHYINGYFSKDADKMFEVLES